MRAAYQLQMKEEDREHRIKNQAANALRDEKRAKARDTWLRSRKLRRSLVRRVPISSSLACKMEGSAGTAARDDDSLSQALRRLAES